MKTPQLLNDIISVAELKGLCEYVTIETPPHIETSIYKGSAELKFTYYEHRDRESLEYAFYDGLSEPEGYDWGFVYTVEQIHAVIQRFKDYGRRAK
jgi:hypothetical protein